MATILPLSPLFSPMKRVLKIVGIAVVAVVVLLLLVVAVVSFRSHSVLNQRYEISVVPPVLQSDREGMERGAHLAVTRGCAECHGADFGGDWVMDNPAMGKIYAPNLTSGRGGVTAAYLDTDWERSIRHGVNPKGRPLLIMPSFDYQRFSVADMGSLIAFLKARPPVDRDTVPVQPGPIMRLLLTLGEVKPDAAKIDHGSLRPMNVVPGVSVAYGAYVAQSCVGCHGTNFSGGKIPGGAPDWPAARNLTPEPSEEFAAFSEADFFRALREGKRPDGSDLSPVMPRVFGQMTDDETRALWLYLKTLPAVATGER